MQSGNESHLPPSGKCLSESPVGRSNPLGALQERLERERGFELMNWLEKATLKFLEIVKGPNHPSVAVCLEKIGKFYFERGDLEEAEPHFERALQIMGKNMGPNHLTVAIDLNALAEMKKFLQS